MKINNKPTVIDLFCGAGGLSKGFELAGYEVLLGIDNIEAFTKTYLQNHSKSKVVCDNISKISIKQIKTLIKNQKVDVIIGGPPCQGFSMAGRRDPKDPRNSLFMDFVRIVKAFKPKYFVLENVRGLLSMKTHKNQYVIDIIQNEFKKIGYSVDKKVLTAADYGVPQIRKRVIVIGTITNNIISFPEPTHSIKPELSLFKPLKEWIGVENILLPKNKVPKEYFHSQKMIDGFRKRHKANKEKGHGFGWQILNLKKPSFTISARYYKDGGDALVMYSENNVRMLTPLECARIQSFPDNFKFSGTKKEVYMQIGNAVPVLLAKAVAEEIKKKL